MEILGTLQNVFRLTGDIVRWTLISARSWSDFWVCLSSEAQVALWQPLFMHLLYTDVYCWVDTAEGKAVHLPSWVRWNGLAGEEYRSVPGIAECVFPRGLPAAILPVGRGKDVRSREQEFSSVSTGWPRGLWKRRLFLVAQSLRQLRNLMKDRGVESHLAGKDLFC